MFERVCKRASCILQGNLNPLCGTRSHGTDLMFPEYSHPRFRRVKAISWWYWRHFSIGWGSDLVAPDLRYYISQYWPMSMMLWSIVIAQIYFRDGFFFYKIRATDIPARAGKCCLWYALSFEMMYMVIWCYALKCNKAVIKKWRVCFYVCRGTYYLIGSIIPMVYVMNTVPATGEEYLAFWT